VNRTCPACHSEYWSAISQCECCEQVICDQCEGAEYLGIATLVCGPCMSSVSEVFEKIRPDFFEAICELIESRDGSIPDEPISLEVFRSIVDCKTVEQVRDVFLRVTPIRKTAAQQGRERKAAA
jgi:hypothetical protein